MKNKPDNKDISDEAIKNLVGYVNSPDNKDIKESGELRDEIIEHIRIYTDHLQNDVRRGIFGRAEKNTQELSNSILKSLLSFQKSIEDRVRKERDEEIIQKIKNGVGYGLFGFTRTDGKNKGKVAINMDDLIQSLNNPKE